MTFREAAEAAVRAYHNAYEQTVSDALYEQLVAGDALTDRKNFDGHVTASMYLLSQDGTRVLLIEHSLLGKLLQPGGHADASDDSPLSAAKRELYEETGVSEQDYKVLSDTPIDIDTHPIPAREDKQEPEHLHHDFGYAARLTKDATLSLSARETDGACWQPLKTLDARLSMRLRELL